MPVTRPSDVSTAGRKRLRARPRKVEEPGRIEATLMLAGLGLHGLGFLALILGRLFF